MTEYASPFADDDEAYLPPGGTVAPVKLNGIVGPFISKLGAVWFHEVGYKKAIRDWLVKNLIMAGQFGIIYGPPGSGKSFLTSDMCLTSAAALMLGIEKPIWFGYRSRPFGVVYVIREDRNDFEVRLQAWRIEKKIPEDQILPFVFLPTALDLRTNQVDVVRLAEEIRGLSLEMETKCGVSAGIVVIDTVNHVLAGGNENGSDVMGAFVINCAKLQELVAITLLGIHHGGKEGGRGPRGHEALHGAAGFEIEVMPAQSGNPNTWTLRKQRAASSGQAHPFKLRRVTVSKDDDGDDITSCIVDTFMASSAEVPVEAGPPIRNVAKDGRLILKLREEQAFRALASAIHLVGRKGPSTIKSSADDFTVTLADWRDQFEKLLAEEDEDPKKLMERTKKACYAAAARFISWGLIEKDGSWVWRTGRLVMNVDRSPQGTYGEKPGKPPLGLGEIEEF